MRLVRSCYDHLAGGIAVARAQRLVEDGAVLIEHDTEQVTERAAPMLARPGIAIGGLRGGAGKRPVCPP